MRREIRDVRAIDPPLIEKKLNGAFLARYVAKPVDKVHC
jgi:hypothetical protein